MLWTAGSAGLHAKPRTSPFDVSRPAQTGCSGGLSVVSRDDVRDTMAPRRGPEISLVNAALRVRRLGRNIVAGQHQSTDAELRGLSWLSQANRSMASMK